MKLTPPNITPGDWRAEGENVLSPKGETIATCPPVFIFGEEKGNVKAIAALPDLLKALESAAKFHRELTFGGYCIDCDHERETVISALTKAGYTIEP